MEIQLNPYLSENKLPNPHGRTLCLNPYGIDRGRSCAREGKALVRGSMEGMKEDFGVIARNSLLLESEQIRFHYQQKKSTKSGWMDLQSSAGQN